MEKALFDWPILLQCDVKAKYRLISRKVSGMKFFACVCCFCFVRAVSFQGQTKIALMKARNAYKNIGQDRDSDEKIGGIAGLGGKNKREAGIIFENPFVDPPL